MKRLFYIAIGVGVGVAAVRQLTKAAQKVTPSGVASSVGESFAGLGSSLRAFVEDIRLGMAEREVELHEALRGENQPPRAVGRHASGSPGNPTYGNGRSAF